MKKGITKEKRRKCAKCGSSPADDSSVKLHRFPLPNKANKPRCELWAKFCFPKNAWQSTKFQNKLYREHKMLCDKHFKSTSFEKKTALSTFVVLEKDKMKGNVADVEIVEMKKEPEEEITTEEHVILSSPLKSTTENIPKQTISQTMIEASEESNSIHNSIKNTMMNTWDLDAPEISQEDFDETYNEWFSQTSKSDRNDDCQLYGKLVTKKLRTYSVYERNLLIYKIDGLLIENPPGFNSSSKSSPTKTSNNPASKAKQSLKKKATSTSSAIESTSLTNSDKVMSSPKLKRKKVKKESLPKEVQISTQKEEPSNGTQVTSTSMPSASPVKIADENPSAVTSSIPKQPVKVTHTIQSSPNQPVKVISRLAKEKSSVQYQPIKVTSSIPNQPVKLTSSIPKKPLKMSSISSQPSSQPRSTSVPSHLPLEITIPETKLVPVTHSKFVASSPHPKGKIVIMKSKSTKFVPSSQPPILITVPSLTNAGNFPLSTQCDMNSLEQLSSIAVTHASETQQYHTRLTSHRHIQEIEMADDMDVVSHEVVLSASSLSPLQNIVETALKYATKDEYDKVI